MSLSWPTGKWCYPLTLLDDHSRFCLGLRACSNQKGQTVQQHLIEVFRRYGLPQAMLMDNTNPWAVPQRRGAHTKLSAWLLRLGIDVLHGRVAHPQTQGKEERFHRTLKAELLQANCFADVQQAQVQFAPWRQMYNCQRPHDALQLQVPASRYRLSQRKFPEVLPEIVYGPLDEVRKVNPVGQFSFHGHTFKTGEAFAGQPIGLRPTRIQDKYDLYFCRFKVGQIQLPAVDKSHKRIYHENL